MYEESFSKLPSVDTNHQLHLDRYIKFISSRPERNLKREKGFNIHHIIPRSMGGVDTKDNKIKLTYKEHFIAHMILYYCGYPEMISAFFLMAHNGKCRIVNKLTSKQYQNLMSIFREEQSKQFSGSNNPNYGEPRSENIRIKVSKGLKKYFETHDNPRKGVTTSEESKKILSIKAKERYSDPKNNPMYGKKQSEEAKIKNSETHKKMYSKEGYINPNLGSKRSEETKQKMRKKKKYTIKNRGSNHHSSLKVKCIELDKIFSCINDGAEEVYGDKKYKSRIQYSLKHNTTSFGFTWKLV